MKKFAILLIITFITAFIVSSCNREVCPAYTQADSEQTMQNV